MANLNRQLLLLTATGLLLAACGDKSEKPEGQVVATIDGQEVTINEMKMESNGIAASAAGVSQKLVEAVGLARVLERKMLAAEAKRRKLDQSPQYVLAKARNDENLLVQALQAEVAGKVSETPREQAQKYIEDNPIIFGDRRILILDQIQFLQTPLMEKLPLSDAKNMGAVERLLLDTNIEYRRAPQQIDTLLLDRPPGPGPERRTLHVHRSTGRCPGADRLYQRRLRTEDGTLRGRTRHFLCAAADPAPGNFQAPAGRTHPPARTEQGQDCLCRRL